MYIYICIHIANNMLRAADRIGHGMWPQFCGSFDLVHTWPRKVCNIMARHMEK